MDIIEELISQKNIPSVLNREVKVGDIYRLLDTTDTNKYLSEDKPCNESNRS